MAEPLKLVTHPQGICNDIVDLLADYLERAKAGEFDGLALVFTHPDGTFGTNYSEHMDTMRLCGALAHVQYRLHYNKDEG